MGDVGEMGWQQGREENERVAERGVSRRERWAKAGDRRLRVKGVSRVAS